MPVGVAGGAAAVVSLRAFSTLAVSCSRANCSVDRNAAASGGARGGGAENGR